MGLPQAIRRYTVDEYLRMERDALDKHEYHEGEILAMAGGTTRHSRIIASVNRELGNGLKGKPCGAYDANLRVRTGTSGRYVYPDATVICGPEQLDPDDSKGETVLNPRLIVEVFSETSEGYDRGQKFKHYCNIPSLQEYVLVSQTEPRVESFFRQPEGGWLLTSASGLDGALKLRSIGVELPLAEVYAGVMFEKEADAPPESGEPRPDK